MPSSAARRTTASGPIPAFLPGSEFNGAGPFLTGLNAPQGPEGNEVTPGVRWMTIRSDNNDKFAQPDGVWIGRRGTPTNVTAEGPALKGAENVVIAGIDHRETAFSPKAFEQAYRFITGRPPATLAIVPEEPGRARRQGQRPRPQQRPGRVRDQPAARRRDARGLCDESGDRRAPRPGRARKTIGADGRWGPFRADPRTTYEFVVDAPGYATTHIYRSPFPRSSNVVNLRAERLADADKDALAVVTLTRPRGYFGVPRDRIALDGKSPPAGIPPGVAGVSTAKLKITDSADPRGRRRVQRRAHRRPRLAGRRQPRRAARAALLTRPRTSRACTLGRVA